MRVNRVLIASAAALCLTAGLARAQSRSWSVCGGNAFNTCASVDLNVSGTSVTVHIWNLSGFFGSYANTIFTGVGFEGIGSVSATGVGTTMTGPVRPGNTPAKWLINNNTQIGGGVNLDIVGTTSSSSSVNNGIASGCANNALLPGGKNQLWENPCALPGTLSDPGYVVLSFNVTGSWDLNNTWLLVKGQNGPNGASTECMTGGAQANCSPNVVPEPVTITLLGSGLVGVGGMLRRRRKNEQS